ncbi:MAG: VCBS repeat-containing protein, partial [Gemmataceae bacterium]|nr:VCBS repeat-containing protein [Gemmataceae bacterium]
MRTTFRTAAAALALGLAASAGPLAAVSRPPRAGDWRHFRGDDRLTGRATVAGRIVDPAVIWRGDAGSREVLLEVRLGAASGREVDLPTTDHPRPADFERRWQLGGPWLDLDGDGVLQPAGPQVGDLLPDSKGLERFEVEGNANRPGPPVARLFTRRAGGWVERWKRPQAAGEAWTEGLVTAAVPIAEDFDGDGKAEIAFQGFHWVYVLDAETGRLKAKARFLHDHEAESGRGYGWFGARDLDGDGRAELVLVGDTQNFVAVLGFDADGRLARRWLKVINFDAYRRISVVRPGLAPVQDIDGDGRPEIVVGVFNYDPATGKADGDDRWHVWALDGRTGATKLDLPGQYLSGLLDVDGDGTAELLTTAAPGPLVPEPSALTVYGFKGGALAARWRLDGESFQLTDRGRLPPAANSSAAGDPVELLVGPPAAGGPPAFFTRRVVDPERAVACVTAWQWDRGSKDGIRPVGRLTGPGAEALAVRPAADGLNAVVRVGWFDGPA